jgi:hypothetical protein
MGILTRLLGILLKFWLLLVCVKSRDVSLWALVFGTVPVCRPFMPGAMVHCTKNTLQLSMYYYMRLIGDI